MRARWLINLALLLTVLGLAIAIRIEVLRDSTPERLLGIEPADLHLIAVERQGEPKILMERNPEGWRLREPMDVDAEETQVGKLLALAEAPVRRSFPERESALDEMELDTPRIRIQLDAVSLAVGGVDPVTQRRYVAYDGVVRMIDDRFYAPLVAAPLDYVSRAPIQRGLPPVFGTLNGVPLAAAAVQALTQVRAERLEPLTGELEGDPLTLKSADGSSLRLLVSADRRRLSRLDLKIRYVLPDPLKLDLDPTALDPTPPAGPSQPSLPDLGPTGAEAQAPFAKPDPDAPVPGDLPLGAPPEVRLTPNGPALESGSPPSGFGAEPYKEAPQGFGTDPFAPDPVDGRGTGDR